MLGVWMLGRTLTPQTCLRVGRYSDCGLTYNPVPLAATIPVFRALPLSAPPQMQNARNSRGARAQFE